MIGSAKTAVILSATLAGSAVVHGGACEIGPMVLMQRGGQDLPFRIEVDPDRAIHEAQELTLIPDAMPSARIIVTSDVLVGFDPTIGHEAAMTAMESCGLGHARRLALPSGRGPAGVYVATMPSAIDAIDAARRALHAPAVQWASPDTRGPIRTRMDDPLFADQWHLENTGQGLGRSGADCEVVPAWTISTGASARIGVVDDGFEVDHPDLVGAIGGIVTNSFGPGLGGGLGSHGTAVAGLIAARANTIGGVGVAPDSQLLLASFNGRTDAQIAMDLIAIEEMGAQVIVNAWDREMWFDLPDVLATTVGQIARIGRDGKGVLVIFPSPEQQTTVEWGGPLASLPDTMCVGGLNNLGGWPGFAFGPSLDIVAPSHSGTLDFVTTDPSGEVGYSDSDYTTTFTGASASAAIAGGVAGLVFDVNPDLFASQVRRILQHTGRGYGDNSATITNSPSRPFDPVTGFSDTYGYGMISAADAVLAAQESVDNNLTWPDSPSDLYYSIVENGIRLHWENAPLGPRGEFDRALVVRLGPDAEWRPVDGLQYSAGDTPATDVEILDRGVFSELYVPNPEAAQTARYAVYTINDALKYSWPTIVMRPRTEPYGMLIDGLEESALNLDAWANTGEWGLGMPNTTTVNTAVASATPDTPAPLPPSLVGFNTPIEGFNIASTDLDGFYHQRFDHRLTSPAIDLTHEDITSASMTYWELMDTEGEGQDMGMVQIIDGENPLEPVLRTIETDLQTIALRWRQKWFDLDDFIGQTIKVRWTLDVNINDELDLPGQHGWMLDLLIVRVDCPEGDCVPETPEGPTMPPPEGGPIETPGGTTGLVRPPRRIVVPDNVGHSVAAQRSDVDLNGVIDARDLAIMLNAFGADWSSSSYATRADLDESGRVDASDLFILLSALSTR